MITLTSYQTTTVLPNPEWHDNEQITGEITIKRTANGATYTYIKSKNNRRRLVFQFQLTRPKSLELKAFIDAYFSSIIGLTDHEGHQWLGNLLNNPFEFEALTGEAQNIQLEFEGIKQGEFPMTCIESLPDPGADRVVFWDDSENACKWLTISTGLQIIAANLTTKDSEIVHNNLSGYDAAKHVTLPGTLASVLSDHNLAAHTGLGLFDSSSDVDHDNVTNTHNLTTDINHNTITNNHNLTTDIDHDSLLNFVATKHFDTTSLTAGSVIISNGTTFVEDNVGLLFDIGNNRLGIGSALPQKNLHIESITPTIRLCDTNAATDGGVSTLIEFYRGNNINRVGYLAMDSSGNDILTLATEYADGEIRLRTGNSVDRLIIDKDGNVSILENATFSGTGHDSFTDFVGNKHIDHTGVEIATAATSGISGGGTIASTRNLALNINGLTGESAIVAADTIPFYDATAGNIRKVTLTELASALGTADEKVKIDAGATAGYLGAAAGDGVLRTSGGIAYADGGDFVTLTTNPGYVDRGDPNAWDITEATMTLDYGWYDLDLSSIVPTGTTAVSLLVYQKCSATNAGTSFRKKGHTNGFNVPAIYSQVANIANKLSMVVACDANRVIQYSGPATITDLDILVKGWFV